MANKNPLVLYPGEIPLIQELKAGDTLAGAAQGSVGATGSAATITVGSTTTGAAGSSASVSNSGTSSAAVLDFTIPRGDTGATGSAGTPGSMAKMAQIVTTGSQATITFSSIAQTSTDLMIVLSGRDTATASGNLGVRLQINGDATSANYTQEIFHEEVNATNNGGNNAAATTGFFCGRIPGSSSNANAVGQTTVMLANYTRTTFYKTMTGWYGSYFGNNAVPLNSGNDFGVWKSTAAITSLTLTAGGTAFVDGTVATLYGMG